MTDVTPSDRPKSVRNRCVIEVSGGVFILSRCFLNFAVSVGALGLSQIFSFFSYNITLFKLICVLYQFYHQTQV